MRITLGISFGLFVAKVSHGKEKEGNRVQLSSKQKSDRKKEGKMELWEKAKRLRF